MYLISIITINLNDATGLERTLKSIENQTYENIELIVVDGCSTDNSLDVIRDFRPLISKSVVEKDHGLYDAMNKGISYATGDFALFLNSGDAFSEAHSLQIIASKIEDKNKLYFGRTKNIYNNSTIYYLPDFRITVDNYKSWLSQISPNHQSILFPKSFYKTNSYDLKYKIASDIDFKIKAINQLESVFVDAVVIDFELGGISTLPRSLELTTEMIAEGLEINKVNRRKLKLKTILGAVLNQYFKYFALKILGEKRYFQLLGKILN